MRFLVIILGSLSFLGGFLLMAHLWGLSQPILEYPSPFFDPARPEVSQPGKAKPASKVLWIPAWDEDPEKALPQTESTPIWVPIFQNRQRELRLWPTDQAWIASLSEERQGPSFEALLPQWRNRRIFLQVLSNSQNIHEQVSQAFDSLDWKMPVLFYSEIEVVVDSMRPLRPQWSYGSSGPDRLRLLSFDSLWILPALSLPRDAWTGPLRTHTVSLLNTNVVLELRRRKKKIVIGPIQSDEDYLQALTWKPEALFFPKGKLPSTSSQLRLEPL